MSPPLGINTSTPQQFLDALQALNLNDIWTQSDTSRPADAREMRLEVQHIATLIQGRENYIKKEAHEAKYHKYVDITPLRLLLTLTSELDTNLRETIKFFDWNMVATSARPFEFGTYIVGGDDYHGEYIIGSDVELDLFELKHKPSIPLSTLIQFKENAAQRGHEIRTALHELKERVPDLQKRANTTWMITILWWVTIALLLFVGFASTALVLLMGFVPSLWKITIEVDLSIILVGVFVVLAFVIAINIDRIWLSPCFAAKKTLIFTETQITFLNRRLALAREVFDQVCDRLQ